MHTSLTSRPRRLFLNRLSPSTNSRSAAGSTSPYAWSCSRLDRAIASSSSAVIRVCGATARDETWLKVGSSPSAGVKLVRGDSLLSLCRLFFVSLCDDSAWASRASSFRLIVAVKGWSGDDGSTGYRVPVSTNITLKMRESADLLSSKPKGKIS